MPSTSRSRLSARTVSGLVDRSSGGRDVPGQFPEERFSFAAFVNPPAVGDLYQIDHDGRPRAVLSAEQFLREFNRETWNDSYDDFGITAVTSRDRDAG